MGIELYFGAVIVLMCCAAMDLIVGVTNDAVNFLNASIGSRVAPRWIILSIASLGILAGVLFSSGMMEVARKGIFHPKFFTMPELITIFMAVMLTDVLLLDLFNTFGLPTSTTVSIVFGLLGAAVGMSLIKTMAAGEGAMPVEEYINTAKALVIIAGILLSVVISFIGGAVAQLLTRLLFTFDYMSRMRRYGALWGGLAMACISFFILIKGARGTSFLPFETQEWIQTHSYIIIGCLFLVSVFIFQMLILFFQVNILKPIILVGTFALAMAFAANDLVNFIGVPMAGMHAYKAAVASGDPLNITMGMLSQQVPSETYLLLLAGAIMVATLWFSKKAQTVTETELSLAKQEEGMERFGSIMLSRVIVRMATTLIDFIRNIIPAPVKTLVARRTDPKLYTAGYNDKTRASWDLLRACVNLMMASIIISYATSMKLPLSTTYVTFMVAMGTSFSDRAWGSESAVYRITGVLTVIGGWFLTALIAYTIAFIFVYVLYYLKVLGAILLISVVVFAILRTHKFHQERVKKTEEENIFNIEEVTDTVQAQNATFSHMSFLLRSIRQSLESAFTALYAGNNSELRRQKRMVKQIQIWINVIIANIFKVLRAMQRDNPAATFNYAQTIRRLQKLSDGYRDIILRSYIHISNNHKGLTDQQKEELAMVRDLIMEILNDVEDAFSKKEVVNYERLKEKDSRLRELADGLYKKQLARIREVDSKTRLSILFYALVGDCKVISKQNLELLEIFNQCFRDSKKNRPDR